jgi:hypothetical protein
VEPAVGVGVLFFSCRKRSCIQMLAALWQGELMDALGALGGGGFPGARHLKRLGRDLITQVTS